MSSEYPFRAVALWRKIILPDKHILTIYLLLNDFKYVRSNLASDDTLEYCTCANIHGKLLNTVQESFICTFSLLISLSVILRTGKFMNQFTISSKYLDMVCYLKQETYSAPISFEVQQNVIWTDNIQSFEMPTVKLRALTCLV